MQKEQKTPSFKPQMKVPSKCCMVISILHYSCILSKIREDLDLQFRFCSCALQNL